MRGLSTQNSHLQIMIKTHVEYQKNLHKTVGVVAYTRYPLLEGHRKDGQKDRWMKGWTVEYYVHSLSLKNQGTKRNACLELNQKTRSKSKTYMCMYLSSGVAF